MALASMSRRVVVPLGSPLRSRRGDQGPSTMIDEALLKTVILSLRDIGLKMPSIIPLPEG